MAIVKVAWQVLGNLYGILTSEWHSGINSSGVGGVLATWRPNGPWTEEDVAFGSKTRKATLHGIKCLRFLVSDTFWQVLRPFYVGVSGLSLPARFTE